MSFVMMPKNLKPRTVLRQIKILVQAALLIVMVMIILPYLTPPAPLLICLVLLVKMELEQAMSLKMVALNELGQ